MTAKQYLQQLSRIQRDIDILEEAVARDRARLESTTVPLKPDRVQSSSKGDAFADAIARLADKDMQRRDLILIYEGLYDRIVDQILGIPNDLQGRVLYEYYVKKKLWKTIADEQHYTVPYLGVIHKKALATFEAMYGPFRSVFENM